MEGKVTQVSNPDGSHVEFSYDENGNLSEGASFEGLSLTSTSRFSYGKVREVTTDDNQEITYTYEFDEYGNEITVIEDPDTGEKYKYKDDKLIGVLRTNGLEIVYEYDEGGTLVKSGTYYKGRVKSTFDHESNEGRDVIIQESGIREEYDSEGQIVFHTLPNGLRYEHEFVYPDKIMDEITTEEEEIDGEIVSVDYHNVTVVSDTSQPKIHRVKLVEKVSSNGETAVYDGKDITSLTLADGTRIFWTEVTEGEDMVEKVLIVYPDGIEIEYENGIPLEVRATSGEVVTFSDKADTFDFHYSEALKAWDFIEAKKAEYELDGEISVLAEFDLDGNAISQWEASGVVSLYDENGRLEQVIDENGNIQAQYEYDEDGNPTKVTLVHYREFLPNELTRIRAEVEYARAQALELVAEREFIVHETVEGSYEANLERLERMRAAAVAQRQSVAAIQVPSKGKAAKAQIAGILANIDSQIAQIDQQIEELAKARGEALSNLDQSVMEAHEEIQTEYDQALTQIAEEEEATQRRIVAQELTPIIIHYYRHYLGRDPSYEEIQNIVSGYDFDFDFDLESFKNTLAGSQERQERLQDVQAIKAAVRVMMERYVNGTDADKAEILSALGLAQAQVINLGQDELQSILNWLDMRTLHFGQSAYLVLESLLDEANIAHQRITLATDLIAIDILMGVITPLEEGDLVLSLFSLRHYAESRGLDLYAARLSYDDLRAMYLEACPEESEGCEMNVIAHVDENHYIIIRKITPDGIVFDNPGHGREDQIERVEMNKDEFLAMWEGIVLSARAPPETETVQELTVEEELQIRGAFLGLIAALVIAAIKAAVTAALIAYGINFAVNVVTGNIKEAFTGVFNIIKSLLTGDLFGAFRQFMDGAFQGFEKIAGFLDKIIPAVGKITHKIVEGAKKIYYSDAVQTVLDSLQIATGVALIVATGGLASPIGARMIGNGISGILYRHTDLSPTAINFIALGAQLVAGFTGSGFSMTGTDGSISFANPFTPENTLEFMGSEVSRQVLGDIAVAGTFAIGEQLGMSPEVGSLISIPVRATIGGLAGGIGSEDGILQSIKDSLLSRQTLGGLVSVGTSISLDAFGAPPILQSFVPGILGQLVASASGGTGGGGGPGSAGTSTDTGKNLFGKIGDVAQRLESSISRVAQSVVNFGSQLISDGWEATKNFFSGIFSRQTQEIMYQAEVADGVSSPLDVGFELLSQTEEYDAQNNLIKVTEHYGNDAGDTATIIGDGLTNTISVEQNIAGKTFSAVYENLGKDATGMVALGGAEIMEDVSDNLQARYLFNDGVFKEVEYIDVNAGQLLSRIQTDNSSKGLQFDEKGNLFNGIMENFFMGTAYAYEAGQLMSSSLVRKDETGIFSISSVFDAVEKQMEIVYNMTSAGIETLYDTQIDLYDQYLDATSAGAQALRQFLDEVLNLDGADAEVYNSTNVPELNQGITVVDMKLDYYKFLESGNLQDLDNLAADLIFDVANRRWRQGIAGGVPKLVEQMSDPTNKVIITPGVNSGLKVDGVGDGFTPEEINALASAFATDGKRVMISHSAGTEAQLKAILAAKQQNIPLPDKFVFFSPRVSREQFEWYLDQAGLLPNQVLVVTADGDFPHYPTDLLSKEARLSGAVSADFPNFLSIYYDYENSRGNYNYLILEKDYDAPSYLEHSGMIEGAIYDHEYDVNENGAPRKEKLRTLYSEFMDK